MVRINIIVEGETEETFVKEILYDSFMPKVCVKPILLGGVRKYSKVKRDIRSLLQDRKAYATTMIDYYGLDKVSDFPKLDQSRTVGDFYKRAIFLEKAMGDDISSDRFIPNLLVHEFEALIFSDPALLSKYVGVPQKVIQDILNEFGGNPEKINNSSTTAPSKRLISLNKRYQKVIEGNLAALDIGLETIKKHCQKFRGWLDCLRGLKPLA